MSESGKTAFQLAKFAGSSFASFAIDWSIFTALWCLLPDGMPGRLFASVAVSRCISLVFNFTCNRKLVFSDGANADGGAEESGASTARRAFLRYLALAGVILAASWAILKAVHALMPGVRLSAAKPVVDFALFLISFIVQKKFIFHKKPQSGVS